jgi:CMP/dCMP kinase
MAISGHPVSGKNTLIARLHEEHKLQTYSIGDMLKEMHKKEDPKGKLLFEQWWRASPFDLNVRVNVEFKKKIENTPTIGDSRFVCYLDRNICLRIFLTAEVNIRAMRAINRGDYPGKTKREINEVCDFLRKRENDEKEMGLRLFGVDYNDQSLYDVIINTGECSVEDELDIIRRAFRPKILDTAILTG